MEPSHVHLLFGAQEFTEAFLEVLCALRLSFNLCKVCSVRMESSPWTCLILHCLALNRCSVNSYIPIL
jgi:hypothetical protein